METIVNVIVVLEKKRRTRCAKTFDLPFKLEVGDSVSLHDHESSTVKAIDLNLETNLVTADLDDILEITEEEYEGVIELLREKRWIIK